MPGAADTYLLGIGYDYREGGEREFSGGQKRVRGEVQHTNRELSAHQAFLDGVRSRYQAFKIPVDVAIRAVKAYATALAAVTPVIAGLVREHVKLDDELVKIETLVGASRSQVDAWRGELVELASRTAKPVAELGAGLFVVTSALDKTRRASEAMPLLAASAEAAAIGMGETATVARAASAAITAYASESLSASDAMDILIGTARAGNFEVSELAPTIGRVLPLAQALGVGFAELGASVATFTRLGVPAAEAITALRSLLNSLIKSTPEAEKALGKMGLTIQAVRDGVAEHGLAAALLELMELTGGNVEVLGEIIPNIEGLALALGTAGAQGTEYAGVLSDIQAGIGNVRREGFERVMESTGFAARQAWGELRLVALTLGDELAPEVRDLAVEFRAWIKANDELVDQLGAGLQQALRAVVATLKFAMEHFEAIKRVIIVIIGLKLAGWLLGTALKMTALHVGANLAAVALGRLGYSGAGMVQKAVGVTGALASWTLGLTVVAAAAWAANEAIKAWGRSSEREIERIVAAAAKFRAETKGVKEETDRLLSETERRREIEAELLRAGIKDPESPEGQQKAIEVDARRHRLRVDQLFDYQERYRAASEERERLDAELAEARAALAEAEALPKLKGGPDVGFFTVTQEEFDDPRLAAAQERLEGLQKAMAEVNPRAEALELDIRRLSVVTGEYVAPAEAATGSVFNFGKVLGEVDKDAAKLAKRLAELRAEQELEASQLERLRDAYGSEATRAVLLRQAEAAEQESEAVRRLRAELEAEQRALQVGVALGSQAHQDILARTLVTAALQEEVRRLEAGQEGLNAADRRAQELRNQATEQLGEEVRAARQAGGDRAKRLELEVEALEALSRIKREDFRTEREWRDAIRAVNVELRVRDELLSIEAERRERIAAIGSIEGLDPAEAAAAQAEINAQYAETARAAEAAIRKAAELDELIGEQDGKPTKIEEWVGAARVLADALGEVHSELADIVLAAADFVEALAAATDESATLQDRLGAVVSGLNVVQAIGTAVTGPNNYAAEGSMWGALIGAIVGTYAGGNTQAGAAIGAAAGGALGSFIGKGMDEFLAEFELTVDGGIQGIQTKAEGKLGGVGRRYMEAIERGLEAALDALGAYLVGIPELSIKVREGVFSVFVGAVTARFESMQEAVDFAIMELLRQGDIIGLSPEVRTAIENSTAETLGGLLEDIDFARWLERLPEVGNLASASANALFDAVDQYQAALRKANELGLETAKIDQWLTHTLDAIRKNVLGIVETDEERLRREIEGFNATVLLLRAENEMRRADLLLKQAELRAELELIAVKHKITLAELEAMAANVAAQGRLTQAMQAIGKATLESVHAMFQALAAIESALLSVDAILAGLPDLISDEELQEALGRLGGGSGKAKAEKERREQELERLEDALRPYEEAAAGLSPVESELGEIGRRFDELAEQAAELGVAEERINAARAVALEQLREEAVLRPIDDALAPGGLRGQLREIRDRWKQALEDADAIFAAGGEFTPRWVLAQAERAEVKDLAEDVIDGLGLPMEDLRDRAAELGDALWLLGRALELGAISAERYDEVMAELAAQAERDLYDMALGLLETMGREEEAQALRAALEEAQFRLEVAQLNYLYEQYLALGLISAEAAARMGALLEVINDEENWPDFAAAPPAQVRQQAQQGDPWAEWKRRFDEVREQIEEWSRLGEPDAARGLRELADRLRELEAAAKATGQLGELRAAYAHAVEDFWDQALEAWEGGGRQSLLDRVAEVGEHFDELAAAARAYGGDVARIEAARRRAIAEEVEAALEPLRGLREELLGERAGRAPGVGLEAARVAFEEVRAGAGALDLEAIEALPGAAEAYLEAFRAFAGPGPAYQALVREILGLVDDLEAAAEGLVPPEAPGEAEAAAAREEALVTRVEQLAAAATRSGEAADRVAGSVDEIRRQVEDLARQGRSREAQTADLISQIQRVLARLGAA